MISDNIIFVFSFDIFQIMDRDQEIKNYQQRWTKFNREMKRQQLEPEFIGKPEDNAQKYAIKLIEKLDDDSIKANGYFTKDIAKKAEQECENNICCICLDLMIPPLNIPYILFPCGHNVCRVCLFENGDQARDVYKKRLSSCPQCKSSINNYAQNRNLMQLICIFTNNKQLLEKQLDHQIEQQSNQNNLIKLQSKCDLLDKERKALKQETMKLRKEQKTMNNVIDELFKVRRTNQEQIFTHEEEALLLKRQIAEKREQIEKLREKIDEQKQKKRGITVTLEPLLMQKEKAEMKLYKKVVGS